MAAPVPDTEAAPPRGARRPLALVVSPVRSWPPDQGNRARIAAMGRRLRARGWSVHFLLSELEGTPSQDAQAAMEVQWDLVRSVPYGHERRQAYADAWGGDDWYDPAIDAAAADLVRTWSYDLCLVNYAWYGKVLEAMPPGCLRVIDTHDAFGGRHERLHAAGTTPVWFYTRPADEGRCLDRADVVIAIQEEEAAWFRDLTDRPVRVVGHADAIPFLPPPPGEGRALRAGYLASGNPSNVQSANELIDEWSRDPFLSARVELHLAGQVCAALDGRSQPFLAKHGPVPDVAAFYAGVDMAVNPNVGGSGLKIKSVEALSYGRPLFATAEGMLGICDVHPPFVMPDVSAMVRAMSDHLRDHPDLAAARAWARETYFDYRDRQVAAFDGLLDMATGEAGTGRP